MSSRQRVLHKRQKPGVLADLGVLASDAAQHGEREGDNGPDDEDDDNGPERQGGSGAVEDGHRVQEAAKIVTFELKFLLQPKHARTKGMGHRDLVCDKKIVFHFPLQLGFPQLEICIISLYFLAAVLIQDCFLS